MESRGYQKITCKVSELLPKDGIQIMGNFYWITNLHTAKTIDGETEWIVEFSDNSYTKIATELCMSGDQQVTAYRRLEDAMRAMQQ